MTSISVVIPAYNRADLLERTLESVARQSYKPYEVIIVDDQSPDNTQEVVVQLTEKYKDRLDIIYILHEKNKGEAGSRNTGIQKARGDYVAFLDSDDEWLPEKLERQVQYLEKNKVDGVFCESFLVDQGDYERAALTTIDHDTILPEKLLTKGCGYGTGTNLLISRDVILNQPFDESLRLFVDVDWLYRVSKQANIKVMHEGLAYYHKAPMRSGAYVEEHAIIFLNKYKALLDTWPWHKRQQVISYMEWNIAFGYQGNQEYYRAAYHFLRGILIWPLRNPKYYLFVPINIIKGLSR